MEGNDRGLSSELTERHVFKQFVYVCSALLFVLMVVCRIYLFALRRPTHVGAKHIGVMVDEVKRSMPGTQRGVCCARLSVFIRRSRLRGRCARMVGRVMEGVHEEFRLARRENK